MTDSNVVHIPCPECGKPMLIRVNGKTGTEFLGCSGYPECTATQPLPAFLAMVRAGATPLPGLDS